MKRALREAYVTGDVSSYRRIYTWKIAAAHTSGARPMNSR